MEPTNRSLRRVMHERGVSMVALSKRSGLNYKTIKRMVSMDRVGSLFSWIEVCKALGCELGDVVVMRDEPLEWSTGPRMTALVEGALE